MVQAIALAWQNPPQGISQRFGRQRVRARRILHLDLCTPGFRRNRSSMVISISLMLFSSNGIGRSSKNTCVRSKKLYPLHLQPKRGSTFTYRDLGHELVEELPALRVDRLDAWLRQACRAPLGRPALRGRRRAS